MSGPTSSSSCLGTARRAHTEHHHPARPQQPPASSGSPAPLPAWHGVGTAGAQPVAPKPPGPRVALTAGVGDAQLFLRAGEAWVPEGGPVSSHGAVPLAVALLGDPPQGIWSQALCKDMGYGPVGRPACPCPLGTSQLGPRGTGTAQWHTCATLSAWLLAPFLAQTIPTYLYGVPQCSGHRTLVCPAGIVRNLQNKWPGWILVGTAASACHSRTRS